jgi:hypothetical protein
MRESDHDYFMRRASEERAAASDAGHPDAERSHLELAHRYEVAAAAAVGGAVVQLNLGAGLRARRTG